MKTRTQRKYTEEFKLEVVAQFIQDGSYANVAKANNVCDMNVRNWHRRYAKRLGEAIEPSVDTQEKQRDWTSLEQTVRLPRGILTLSQARERIRRHMEKGEPVNGYK